MNTAEYLIKKLEELGITDIFGVPGDYNFDILYAINNNPNVRWIGCTNELNAGYASDGYARQRGYGALLTTFGVGELSSVNAIAGSMAENVPVISIVGAPSTKSIENKSRIHHNLAEVQSSAFYQMHKQVTVASAFLTRDNAKLEIDRILKIFVKEKKPVYISIPSDIAKMEISDRDVDYGWSSDTSTLSIVVEKINEKIKKSKSPVILGDILVKRFDAVVEYREFVEKSGIPVTNFLMGTGLINSGYEKYLGTYFSKFSNPFAKNAIDKTDCLISIGTIYSDLNSFGLNLPHKIDSHIAIYGTYTYIENKKYENVKMSDILQELSRVVQKYEKDVEKSQLGYKASEIGENVLNYDYIYSRLQEFLKDNDIIFVETGMIPHAMSEIKYPNNIEFNSQLLWASIGWATPAAFGASIAVSSNRVVLITGDGAHQMTALELGNMLRFGVKPVIIVLNNKGYTTERILCKDAEAEFNDIVQMNYSKFSRVFEGDIWSTRVTTAEDFDRALKVTQIMNKLCYIEACVDAVDVPRLTKEVFGEKNLSENTVKEIKLPEIKKPEKIVLSKTQSFETVVHESLKLE